MVPGTGYPSWDSALQNLSCPTASYCLAVGQIDGNTPLAEQMIGDTWSELSDSELPSNANLVSVSCPRAEHCYVVGTESTEFGGAGFVAYLDGTSWTVTPLSLSGFFDLQLGGISCSDDSDCVGVGNAVNDTTDYTEPVAATLSSGSWSEATLPHLSEVYYYMNELACSDSSDCTVVGEVYGSSETPVVETLADGSWSIGSGASVSGISALNGVSCLNASDCVAVGSDGGNVLIEELPDGSWSVETGASEPGPYDVLSSVSCVDTSDCVAVGEYNERTGDPGLMETLADGSWAVTTNPSDVATAGYYGGVSCVTTSVCTAVGSLERQRVRGRTHKQHVFSVRSEPVGDRARSAKPCSRFHPALLRGSDQLRRRRFL